MRLRTYAAVLICAAMGFAASAADEKPSSSGVVDSFVGLSTGEVTDRLGEPALAAKEPPAQMWRYSLEDCTLYLFLYALEGKPTLRVTHAELTWREDARTEPQVCLVGGARTPARRKHVPAASGD